MERFTECFSSLVDPRKNQAQHDLTEMLFISLLATLSGATSCCDIALFGQAKEAMLRTILVLEHGIPSHDTFSRVFRILDPDSLEKVFRSFTKAFAATAKIKGVVAIDGKALRRAYESGRSHMPPVMVTAWSATTRMALANVQAPGNNEAAGALQLVELLQLKGCVVTADALHCHRGMAKAIVERGGDYVLAVKNNQPGLLRDAKAAIAAAERKKAKQVTTKDADHGRKEARTAIVTSVKEMAEKHDFPGLKAVARITSKRGSDKTVERYFLLTQCYKPAELLRIVREHWGIENVLHWTLDVVLDEDQARSRKDHAPANLAVMRRLALNIARAHPDTKTSLRGKLKRAAWDDSFLVDMLLNMR
ncbi:ISAs1 family transposase [Bradyrhizobium sp. CSA207]|uniref:ISAs1 family transposase n=1 Tax=Bradyrhizobium sp. CSA207 TaxID=2698826 RepID=UPI0023AF5013|nr:ISAs1 family transposase [Bradyrhizobium sp. CSA207]MDE5447347.1 ISAs1 family transposase [Bradyrhizobium sp. CSA207]